MDLPARRCIDNRSEYVLHVIQRRKAPKLDIALYEGPRILEVQVLRPFTERHLQPNDADVLGDDQERDRIQGV